ncbi:glycoside hydrolase family 18 protein [Fredinandcohnia sp. QZ13]|uniref:glycoside hydrolase family 18 protein n=1 Tax=Fredinandcohnia sp. QZ13 TaxID=3073144 RepID=UPI002852FD11|nr:glycoside hydrolase family 18 protein [Fredinandcohnia sp. QZ13]MDR4886349.1 glycoside hydrolase family 18 protein [Fredinandcohnia sp. QZ13]
MKIRYIILPILLVVIFIGGFLTGTIRSNESQPENKITKNAPQSSKTPVPKEMPKLDKTQTKVLVGYIQDFRDPNQIDYSKLTHIIFSFVHPTKDGQILFTGDHAADNLRNMVTNAHKHHTKAMLAVGGWFHMNGGESYDYFSEALANANSQEKLVNELIGVVERENLDGIDIDFEHPRTDADAKNLYQFIKTLGDKLHANNKELSIAVHSKIHGQTLTELGYVKYEPAMFQYVDHVNIMAYDGQWDGGYHAENLSPYPFTESIVNYWSTLFDSHKLPKSKLVLGVPFYGQPADSSIKPVSYEAIIENNPENAVKDTVNMNGTTYYYNGQTMMTRKTELALNHGFGGMMIWELGLDAKGGNSLTNSLYESIAATRIKNYYTLKK